MKDVFAPSLKRSWLQVELILSDKKKVTSKNIKIFQKQLALICGMHIFCGPLIIAPDAPDELASYYFHPKFKPRDWNVYSWWTQPESKNIVSILDHSHTYFYYYPEHNLIDISLATCKDYNLNKALEYISSYWMPDKKGIRYAFISPEISSYSWKLYK